MMTRPILPAALSSVITGHVAPPVSAATLREVLEQHGIPLELARPEDLPLRVTSGLGDRLPETHVIAEYVDLRTTWSNDVDQREEDIVNVYRNLHSSERMEFRELPFEEFSKRFGPKLTVPTQAMLRAVLKDCVPTQRAARARSRAGVAVGRHPV
ncbi:hypothetical protein [Fontimonas sp. SYSU GA230001]|uniref:hypothetical protein n=1 Tax=Fontimonas sp. SYSU GA230001 TaxID=3142450 RepID=UPI0032B40DA6